MSLWTGHFLLICCLCLTACAGSSQAIQPATVTAPVSPTKTPTALASPVSEPTRGVAAPPTGTPDTDPAYYFGGLVITLDNIGQTIPLKQGQNFMLNLGDTYRWDVTIAPPGVLTRNMKITPGAGEQGLYIARTKGQATLRAVGNPMCRLAQPPCTWPSVLFQIEVLIE